MASFLHAPVKEPGCWVACAGSSFLNWQEEAADTASFQQLKRSSLLSLESCNGAHAGEAVHVCTGLFFLRFQACRPTRLIVMSIFHDGADLPCKFPSVIHGGSQYDVKGSCYMELNSQSLPALLPALLPTLVIAIVGLVFLGHGASLPAQGLGPAEIRGPAPVPPKMCFCCDSGGLPFFHTLGVGLLDFKLNSSPHPEIFPCPKLFSSPGLLLECPESSLECKVPEVPNPEAQPQSLPGMPTPRVSPSAQPQNFPEVPNRRVCLESPTPDSPRSAQPQSVPGVPNPRVSLPREGGDVRSRIILDAGPKQMHPLPASPFAPFAAAILFLLSALTPCICSFS